MTTPALSPAQGVIACVLLLALILAYIAIGALIRNR